MQQDTFTARVAALTLAIALLGLIAVVALLAYNGKDVPAVLTGALGLVLGGLLPSPITKAVQPSGAVNVAMPAVVHLHPEDIAKIRSVPAPRARAQKGEVGCAALAVGLVLLAAVVVLIVWAVN